MIVLKGRSGRTNAWLKTKTFEVGDFVLIGVERQEAGPAIALLAREEDGRLAYAGGAAVTLKEADRERFWRAVDELAIDNSPLPIDRKAAWVEPKVHLSARYLRSEEKLRHSTLDWLRL